MFELSFNYDRDGGNGNEWHSVFGALQEVAGLDSLQQCSTGKLKSKLNDETNGKNSWGTANISASR